MMGKRFRSKPIVTCWRGHHVVRMEHLRLQSPVRSDTAIMRAAASDPEAQRWLGWYKEDVIRDSRRDSLLARQPGRGRAPAASTTWLWNLIAVDEATGLLAGAVGGNRKNGELGGYLAPRFRGRHLGTELFAGAVQFAHYHLGEEHVYAATEPANTAAVRALLSAGFTPIDGPEVHGLLDGRVVPARWFQHATGQPTQCAVMTV
jgi:RimJ/RimL family protein N-acetyltransferase